MFWAEIGCQFWPFWSQIGYGFCTSLELGMVCLEEATFSSFLVRPSTKALYNAAKVIIGPSEGTNETYYKSGLKQGKIAYQIFGQVINSLLLSISHTPVQFFW